MTFEHTVGVAVFFVEYFCCGSLGVFDFIGVELDSCTPLFLLALCAKVVTHSRQKPSTLMVITLTACLNLFKLALSIFSTLFEPMFFIIDRFISYLGSFSHFLLFKCVFIHILSHS